MDLVDDGWSTAEVAELAGLSERTIRRRVADARERRETGEFDSDRPEVGDDDVEWLELVERFSGYSGHGYYDLSTDTTSADGTTDFVLIGTGRGGVPRRNRIGSGQHVDTGQSYRAKDDGLKGGK